MTKEENTTALSGAKGIMDYCIAVGLPHTWVTILKLHYQEGFPLTKIGGIYESDKEVIAEWRKNKVLKSLGITLPPAAPPPKPSLENREEKGNKLTRRTRKTQGAEKVKRSRGETEKNTDKKVGL